MKTTSLLLLTLINCAWCVDPSDIEWTLHTPGISIHHTKKELIIVNNNDSLLGEEEECITGRKIALSLPEELNQTKSIVIFEWGFAPSEIACRLNRWIGPIIGVSPPWIEDELRREVPNLLLFLEEKK